MSLAGKIAVVTGGATGIGQAIAYRLATAGARVAIGGRRLEKLRAAAETFTGQPPIQHYECNVADRSSVARFFEWAHGALGAIDILVNGAGANIKNRSIAEMRPEQWDDLMQ